MYSRQSVVTLYIAALSLLAIFSGMTYFSAVSALQEREDDGQIINIAGRQRMLSQRIAKSCLYLFLPNYTEAKKQTIRQELHSAANEFELADLQLKGLVPIPQSTTRRKNTPEIQALYEELHPLVQALLAHARFALKNSYHPDSLQAVLPVLSQNEQIFLEKMDSLVLLHQNDARQKIADLKKLELVLFLLTLLLLLLELLFIFLPLNRHLHKGRVLLETQNKNLRKALEEKSLAQDQLIIHKTVIDQMDLGLFIWKRLPSIPESTLPDFRLETVNSAAEQILNLRLNDLTGSTMSELFPKVFQEDQITLDFDLVLRNQSSSLLDNFMFEDVTGKIDYFSLHLIPISAERIGVLFENISSRKQHEQKLVQLNEKLAHKTAVLENTTNQLQVLQENLIEAEKLAALGETVGNITHEINTPIGVAVTAASVVQELAQETLKSYNDKQLTQSQFEKDLLQLNEGCLLILNNLNRACQLMADFKSIAIRQLNKQNETFDLCLLMRQVVHMMHPALKKSGVSVHFDLPERMEIEHYPGIFAQILMNLITNSLRHGFTEHSLNPSIHISLYIQNDELIWLFEDNGIGIAPEFLVKIFEPFYTTGKNQGGSGLGLSIVKTLVNNHLNGTISCQNGQKSGLMFEIIFPLSPSIVLEQ